MGPDGPAPGNVVPLPVAEPGYGRRERRSSEAAAARGPESGGVDELLGDR